MLDLIELKMAFAAALLTMVGGLTWTAFDRAARNSTTTYVFIWVFGLVVLGVLLGVGWAFDLA